MVFAPRETAASIGWQTRDNSKSGSGKKKKRTTTPVDVPVSVPKAKQKTLPSAWVKKKRARVVDNHSEHVEHKSVDASDIQMEDNLNDCELFCVGKLPVGVVATLSPNVSTEHEAGTGRMYQTIIVMFGENTDKSSDYLIEEELAITGRAKITVLEGSVEILGFTLTASSGKSVVVDSPSWMSVLCLKPKYYRSEEITMETKGEEDSLKCSSKTDKGEIKVKNKRVKVKITSMSEDEFTFFLSSRSEVRSAINVPDRWSYAADAIVKDYLSREKDNSEKIEKEKSSIHNATLQKCHNVEDNNTQNKMDTQNFEEKDVLPIEKISSPPHPNRILVCGAKGVGKSTYVRYLANRLLSAPEMFLPKIDDKPSGDVSCKKVAILDCDAGQPELSPSGMLSLTIISKPLLSPPHVHMVCGGNIKDENETSVLTEKESYMSLYPAVENHESAYYYGHSTSKANPISYVDVVTKLVQDFESFQKLSRDCKDEDHLTTPLIVNTDGWVKGMGYEIISSILDVVNPGHVVQILGSTRAKFFDLSPHALLGRQIHVAETFGRRSQENESDLRNSPPSRSASPTPHTLASGITRSLSTTSLQSIQEAYASPSLTDAKFHDTNAPIPSSTLRALRLCCYFLGGYDSFLRSGAIFQQSGVVDEDNVIANTIARLRPYAVPLSAVRCIFPDEIGFHIQSDRGNGKSLDYLFDNLNGSIVGLCHQDVEANSNISPSAFPCVGLGIVRGIDRMQKLLFILTPVPVEQLKSKVNTLLAGQINLPLECIFRGVHSESFPFQSCDGISIGFVGDSMKN